MIIGEYDQSFGDSTSGLAALGQANPRDPKPVRVVQVIKKDGTPVPGVQLNVVDEDKVSVRWAAVTDKNGKAVVPVEYNPPTVKEGARRSYIRVMLVPSGYSNPSPRTVATSVEFSEAKVDPFKIYSLYADTSKLKPDVIFRVEVTGTPFARVELTDAQIEAKDLAGGGFAFRVLNSDGTVAKPDRNTPYTYTYTPFYFWPRPGEATNPDKQGTLDIDPNGIIWAWTSSPMMGILNLVPYFEGRPYLFGGGSSKPEWAVTRVLNSSRPYPYVYDIKRAPDGGLMPAGKIMADELASDAAENAPLIVTPPSPTPSPSGSSSSSSSPPPSDKAPGSSNTFFYVMLAVIGIAATFAYFRLKED